MLKDKANVGLDSVFSLAHSAAMTDIRADVAILGGGLVGAALAAGLASCGLATVLIDQESPVEQRMIEHDGRGSAVALGSRLILEGLGVWPYLVDAAGPIRDIRVTDGPSRLFMHYDHRDVGDQPVGYIIENLDLRRGLHKRLAELTGPLTWLAPATAEAIEVTAGAAHIRLTDGRRVSASLLVGADGRGSQVRKAAGIGLTRVPYGQTGIVCSVRHEPDHQCVAHERFLASGPFALLPLIDRQRSSVVWTERDRLVPAMMALDDVAFSREMTLRFGPTMGDLTLDSRRWAYPLSAQLAHRMAAPRLVLIGDAAHGVHPISGQGVNLGWRDVAALAEMLVDAHRLGQDLGDVTRLRDFEAWRRPDILAMLAATDGLNRLFSNDIGPIRLARDIGLAVVDKLPMVKKVLMRHAMGVLGPQPRLVRGEKL